MVWLGRRKKKPFFVFPPAPPRKPFVTYGLWESWMVAMETPERHTAMSPDDAEALGQDLIVYAKVVRLVREGKHDQAAYLSVMHRRGRQGASEEAVA